MKFLKWLADKMLTAFLAISIAFGFLYVTAPEAAQNLIALYQVNKRLGSAISGRISPAHLRIANDRDFGIFYNGTHRVFYVMNATNYGNANRTDPYFGNSTTPWTNGTALYFYVNTDSSSTGNFTWTTTLPCANKTLCGF